MARTAVRLGLAVVATLGALALGSVTSVHAYPITGVSVAATCTLTAQHTAHCSATGTATTTDSSGKTVPESGAQVTFKATYTGVTGAVPGGPCGGMNPCSGVTDANGQITSTVDLTACGGIITITATITNPQNPNDVRTATSQAELPPCAGVAGAGIPNTGIGLPPTSTDPPGADHRIAEGLLAGGALLALGGAGSLVAVRRRSAA
jgi:hypothetical protein